MAAVSISHPLATRVLPDEPIIHAMNEAVITAMQLQCVAAVVAPKGAGKGTAIELVVQEFHAVERDRLLADGEYRARRIVRCTTPRAGSDVDLFALLYLAAFDEPLGRNRFPRPKSPDEMRRELCTRLRDEGVAMLIIDEAECLTARALVALRDVVAELATAAGHGVLPSPDTMDATPAGFPIVLVGTEDLEHRLQQSDEWGRRVLRVVRLEHISAARAGEVLAKLSPLLAAGSVQLGAAWNSTMTRLICGGRPTVAMSTLTDVVRMTLLRSGLRNGKGPDDFRLADVEEAVRALASPLRGVA